MTEALEVALTEAALRSTEAELHRSIDELEARHAFMIGVVEKLSVHAERCLLAAEKAATKSYLRDHEVSSRVLDLLARVSGRPCYCGAGCGAGTCTHLCIDEIGPSLIGLAVLAGVVAEHGPLMKKRGDDNADA